MDFHFNCECRDEYGENCGRTVMLLMAGKKIRLVDIALGFNTFFTPEQVEINENGVVSFNDGQYTMYITSECFRQHLKLLGGKIN